ncbi:MAG TPA: D-2-hydroxyacid dehydrogenase [Vicinamibacterales bacterium]|nr:D-2-hydroxyacid dehydrogenase [Vicinamibacterales bacterium]
MRVLISIQQAVHAWQIPAAGVATLRAQFPDIDFVHATDDASRARGLRDAEIAYTWILSTGELAAAPRLQWLHTSAVAVETLCLPELFARGVIVSNTRAVQSSPIAEHVFAVVLALAKQIPFVLARQQQRHWSQNELVGDRLPWLLNGRTLGLIGAGTIGSEIARLGAAFGMRVVALTRRGTVDSPHIDQAFAPGDLPALLDQTDVLVIAAPLTPETLQMIGAAQLARMKRGALLVNVGRARIIDHLALADAVRSGQLGGASLDVFHQEPLPSDDPLWALPNVILTPHTSGFRHGHWDDVLAIFADNLRRYLAGEPVRFRIEPSLGY